MNVLHLIHHAGDGGTERYVLSVAGQLRDSGRGVPYFAYTQDGLLRERMEAAGIPVFRIDMPSRYSPRAARAVAALCREKRIGVIHTHFLRENYIALLSKRYYKTPLVIYTHHIILPNGPLTRLSNRLLSRRQSAVLAGCEQGARQLVQNGVPKEKIAVVRNGVDPGLWARTDGAPVRKALGIPESMFVMVYSARLVAGKGHAFLLEAAARLKELTRKPFRLIMAGDGPLLEETKALAGRLGLTGETVFPGFYQDMRSLLSAADLCLNASESETICMSILEGMAAGLPVVATDVGGTGELVTGGSGILVGYGQTGAMAGAMLAMMEGAREEAARKALEIVHSRFTARGMAEEIFYYYQGGKPDGGAKEEREKV